MEILGTSIRRLPKEEQDFLESMDKMFASPFFKPSIEFRDLFHVTLLRNPDILNNTDLILRLWNSGLGWYRKVITIEFEKQFALAARKKFSQAEISALIRNGVTGNRAAIPPDRITEVYQRLMRSEFVRTVMKASNESVELSDVIEGILKRLDNSTTQNNGFFLH